MTYRKKTIKGLRQHVEGSMFDRCGECPYYEFGKGGFSCRDELLYDALALLKEQEALIHFLEHQREKGHWIFGETNGHGWMKCSQCCVSQDGQTSCYLFCPCCGADMTEGR